MKLIGFFLTLTFWGCSTSTTFTVADGGYIEGKATRIDSETLSILTDEGQTEVVKDSTITDIDHPGNVAFTIGSAVAVSGILLSGYVFGYHASGEGDGFGILGLIYTLPLIAIGLPPAIWGGITWLDSKDTFDASNLSLQPSLFDKDGFAPGINVNFNF